LIGRVAALWRYPVSSLGGERLDRADLVPSGLAGDRTHGIFHAETGEVAYPGRHRQWAALPRAFSRLDAAGGVEVSADGEAWHDPASPHGTEALSRRFGFPAAIRRYAEDGAQPRYRRAPIHLLTTSALRTLQAAIPGSLLDERRFRPNLLIDTPEAMEGIPEYAWMGRRIRIGNAVLRGTIPCARCLFTALEQDGLPEDRDVYRILLHSFGRDLGLYCEIEEAGEIRHGDALLVEEPALV